MVWCRGSVIRVFTIIDESTNIFDNLHTGEIVVVDRGKS